MDYIFQTYWPLVFAGFERVVALTAALHALLKKRETNSVIGWVGLIWLTPLIGSSLYFCFGVNRIQRKGNALQDELERVLSKIKVPVPADIALRIKEAKERHPKFAQLVDAVGRLTGRPLLPGNKITPLINGDAAYPAMLAAIDGAQHSISLESYIFDFDDVGERFVDALAAATERGVAVRVLIDDVGAQYSRRSTARELRRRGVTCHMFLPTWYPVWMPHANLRNHRKIMVVDGVIGFTGGINIRAGCILANNPANPTKDLHFQFEGPVVTHLQEAFVTDWAFVTGEVLEGEAWLPLPEFCGESLARGISDGPDEDFERLLMTILAAVAVASRRIVIMTPYFLPDVSLIRALNTAALRGVDVKVLLPGQNNIALVQWASNNLLAQVIEEGVQVYMTAPPFDHTKLMLVDEVWALVGSTNLDPRSLRLNFEFNVECYDLELARVLSNMADEKLSSATKLTIEAMQNRNLLWRLRDGVARLFTPYL
ncbi:MAG: cardiolipin synthase [Pirellulaceae bacterium]|nr:cardiolipin synthase [Pirellulaceae bacterium]